MEQTRLLKSDTFHVLADLSTNTVFYINILTHEISLILLKQKWQRPLETAVQILQSTVKSTHVTISSTIIPLYIAARYSGVYRQAIDAYCIMKPITGPLTSQPVRLNICHCCFGYFWDRLIWIGCKCSAITVYDIFCHISVLYYWRKLIFDP